MTGKQHVVIGGVVTLGLSYAYLGGDFTSTKAVTSVVLPAVIGGIAGSYMPDIDSKKSKASQAFNKVLVYIIGALLVGHFLDIPVLDDLLTRSTGEVLENVSLLAFTAIAILGKLSPHRGFTHKWLGTIAFCGLALLVFDKYIAYGFIIGYLSHILADRFTAAGENLKFFEFRLPLLDSKGRVKCHF